MPRVREIQFIDEDGTARGSVTNLEAIKLLTQHSELVRFSRNRRAFENYAKKNAEGVLRFPISKLAMSDETLEDLVAFLNGEPIYKYNNVEEAIFRNKVVSYENIGTEKDFGGNIYSALQYLMLPESKIKKIFEARIIFPRRGEYENNVERAMNELHEYEQVREIFNNLNQRIRNSNYLRSNEYPYHHFLNSKLSYNPTYQFPDNTMNLTNSQYEAWLRSGGINTLRNYQKQHANLYARQIENLRRNELVMQGALNHPNNVNDRNMNNMNNNNNSRDNRNHYEEALMNQFNSGQISLQELDELWRMRGGTRRKRKQRRRATHRRVR
jgi:hypothetical protein